MIKLFILLAFQKVWRFGCPRSSRIMFLSFFLQALHDFTDLLLWVLIYLDVWRLLGYVIVVLLFHSLVVVGILISISSPLLVSQAFEDREGRQRWSAGDFFQGYDALTVTIHQAFNAILRKGLLDLLLLILSFRLALAHTVSRSIRIISSPIIIWHFRRNNARTLLIFHWIRSHRLVNILIVVVLL